MIITAPNYNLPIAVGSSQSYTIEIKNLGPDTAENVICTAYEGTSFGNISAITSTGAFVNNVWNIGSLQNGATVTLTITNILNTYCDCTHEI